ncbi:carbon monoxide dehydrogenase subunit G [Nocardioides sp. zg-1228]|uniref:SRPBCC family protein n=1 Tax=Nocardioides sp. zg-1228 TaxID=2763008 RepID=UPI00164345D9|nr:carbon monoxide dehydrogenase subunit G [Nocardioides sp. zg-1228]MBC2933925.1 carbon monoxide dehydrogenase subunit G [Nocardioides sp. zg-1228]QSF58690.1 carbon monoxide dehydrogenase subunit G [Nocardioides sp. zg-1228]
MKFTGENVLAADVARAWDALLDPGVLVRTIPGCERLEATGENAYAMTVTAGVASIKGTYAGSCELRDLVEHESLVMRLDGAGAPGTIGATVNVRFAPEGSATRVSYDADAVVGGMIGGVGQRMLTSVSKRMAGEFFGNVDAALAGGPDPGPTADGVAPVAAEPAAVGQVFVAPAPSAAGSRQDFLTGVAVGAGLVLAGVIVGGIVGRRR